MTLPTWSVVLVRQLHSVSLYTSVTWKKKKKQCFTLHSTCSHLPELAMRSLYVFAIQWLPRNHVESYSFGKRPIGKGRKNQVVEQIRFARKPSALLLFLQKPVSLVGVVVQTTARKNFQTKTRTLIPTLSESRVLLLSWTQYDE